MDNKTTLVIGASENPARYSNLAINRLKKHKHQVFAVGKRKGVIAGVMIETEKKYYQDIDTITLYINPSLQKEYYDYIISLHPRRIIFNPGTENEELADLALQNGILSQEACTLVLLSTDQY